MEKVLEKNGLKIEREYYKNINGFMNGLYKQYNLFGNENTNLECIVIDYKQIGEFKIIDKEGNITDKLFFSLKEPAKRISELEYKGELSFFRMLKNSPSYKSIYSVVENPYDKFEFEDLVLGNKSVEEYRKCRSYYVYNSVYNSPSKEIDYSYVDRVLFLLEYGDFYKLTNGLKERGLEIKFTEVDVKEYEKKE